MGMRLTLQVFSCQQYRSEMMFLNELANLGCDFGALEAHHEQLAHSPWIRSINELGVFPGQLQCLPVHIVPDCIVLHTGRRQGLLHDGSRPGSSSWRMQRAWL